MLHSDGTLIGKFLKAMDIMRFGVRNNGAVTRPAPVQGLGFESDKFDTIALNNHLTHILGRSLKRLGR